MHCLLCGNITVWIDRLGLCLDCSPLLADAYGTELLAADPVAAAENLEDLIPMDAT